MPSGLVKMYAGELTAIRARENLDAVSIACIGSCTIKQEYRKQILNEWSNLANREDKKKITYDQKKILLASMGVKCQNH